MRPLNKKYFGPTGDVVKHLECNAWVEGDTEARVGFIVKQTGASRYIVDTTDAGGLVGVAKLVGEVPSEAGQMTITVAPVGGGSTGGSGAVAEVRMVAMGSLINNAGSGYEVGDLLTVVGGTGDAITINVETVDVGGEILSASMSEAGFYSVLPAATGAATTGGTGTGATFGFDFVVQSVIVTNGGSGYTDATITFSSGAATAEATIVNGVITEINVINAGGNYVTAPSVVITTSVVPVTEFARKISAHLVSTFDDNVYVWKLDGETVVDGEATIQSA